MKLRGVNLGNWLVLEKWMGASPLSVATCEDERGLIDEMPSGELELALEMHRRSYITVKDSAWLARVGVNLVRIPVPYFIWGTANHLPCIEHLDNAFAWAERQGLKVLIDLHTVPLSQNGFDNGGYLALCAWAQDQARIDYVVDVLEALARRYAGHPALWGIEALNEPASQSILEGQLARYADRYPDRVARSAHIPREILLAFYKDVYRRLRPLVGPDVALVFHDQFELEAWNELLPTERYDNVVIDTHQYLNFSEWGFERYDLDEYLARLGEFSERVRDAARYHPVMVGEWSIANHSPLKKSFGERDRRLFNRALADAQIEAWDQGIGGCYWSYRVDDPRRSEWSLRTCVAKGWVDMHCGTGDR